MPIRTDCSSCGKKLRIRDDYIGRRVKCPQCGSAFLAEAVENTAIQAETPKPVPLKSTKDKVAAKPMAKKQPPPDDEEDEDGAHTIVGESLPHFGQKQRSQPARLTQDCAIAAQAIGTPP